ncbi:MAG: LysM peptidoglycan-binding domain-containing protein [Planctomycetota bacterium]
MTRHPRFSRFAAGTLIAPITLAFTGCNSVQLPDGYAWNITPEKKNDFDTPRGSFRWGFDQSRINESLPATSRDRTNYDYAAVLPKPNIRPAYEPQYTTPATAPIAAATATPDDLYTALDPVPAPPTGNDAAVFTLPTNDSPTIARSAFRAPATTEVRILGGDLVGNGRAEAPSVAGTRTHTVVKGDNYWNLAKQYYGQGIRMKDIQAANPGIDPKKLQIGDTLVIPE